MTILLTDYGGTAPSGTCEVIAEEVPSLYPAWGDSRVLAVCEEIQRSELPEQSALYQRMFQRFNVRYFGGRLPFYRVRVVYDAWYWATVQCGYSDSSPAPDTLSFLDGPLRQIFIKIPRFVH